MKKKILVVGGTGFIGVNLLKKLSLLKFKCSSLSTSNPKKNKKVVGVNYIILDITNKKEFKKLNKLKFDVVINLGGYIDHSKTQKTFKSHFSGVKNLVNYFKDKKLKLFIQIGSSLEYGKKKSPQQETIKCKPCGNYGLAKYKASNYLINNTNLNFNYIILRLYQVYGPYQDTSRLIPQVITSCINNEEFKCTMGSQLRDFLYIDDLVSLIIKILKIKKLSNDVYNVGSGKPKSVKSIIKIINKKLNTGKPLFGAIKMRKDEINKLYPSIKKIKSKFNWVPKTNILQGFTRTIKYYEKD